MFTACPLGVFPRWSYLFDERIEILMAVKMNVAYWLGCPLYFPDRMIVNVLIDK